MGTTWKSSLPSHSAFDILDNPNGIASHQLGLPGRSAFDVGWPSGCDSPPSLMASPARTSRIPSFSSTGDRLKVASQLSSFGNFFRRHALFQGIHSPLRSLVTLVSRQNEPL